MTEESQGLDSGKNRINTGKLTGHENSGYANKHKAGENRTLKTADIKVSNMTLPLTSLKLGPLEGLNLRVNGL